MRETHRMLKKLTLPMIVAAAMSLMAPHVEAAKIPVVIQFFYADQNDMVVWNKFVIHHLIAKINKYLKNDLSQCKVDIPQEWKDLVTPTDIQIELATQDPQGRAFLGVNARKIPGGLTKIQYNAFANPDFVSLIEWPEDKYLNIIFAPTDNPGAVATAFTETLIPGHHFIVFDTHNQVLSMDFPLIDGLTKLDYMAASIVHELFHVFGNNKHLWGSTSKEDGYNIECKADDGLFSTPIQEAPTSLLEPAPTKYDECQKEGKSLGKMYMNFMDYSQAICMATNEQVDAMWTDLKGPKSSLIFDNPALTPGSCYLDQYEPNAAPDNAFDIDLALLNDQFMTLATLCEGEIDDYYRIIGVDPNKPYIKVELRNLPADYNLEVLSFDVEDQSFWTEGISINEGTADDTVIIDLTEQGQIPKEQIPTELWINVFSFEEYSNITPYYVSIAQSNKPFQ